MKALHKANEKKGETIIEVLCAILVGALAAGLLMYCITASVSMAKNAKKADKELMISIGESEEQSPRPADPLNPVEIPALPISGAAAEITYVDESDTAIGSPETISIKVYGRSNVYSYKKSP